MWSYKNVKTWCIQAPEEVANNARLSQFTEQKISVVVCEYILCTCTLLGRSNHL